MSFKPAFKSPFVLSFSFEKLLNQMHQESEKDSDYAISHASVLEKAAQIPELLTGINDPNFFVEHRDFLKELFRDLFPPLLSKNEIKAAGFPFYNYFFNPSERFKKILQNAGQDFDLFINGMDPHQYYVISCCLILRDYYKIPINFSMPFIFDIPNEEGIIQHYRFLNNIDFMEIKPLGNHKELTESDIKELLENYDDQDLWLEKFPPESWELKGFALITFYDATVEIAVSNLKSKLINIEDDKNLKNEINSIFRSIFMISDLEVGYTAVNVADNTFVRSPINYILDSFMLSGSTSDFASEITWEKGFKTLLQSRKYFTFSDIDQIYKDFPQSHIANHIYKSGIKSIIFAPIIKDKRILGIFEITSKQKSLNSILANKMEIVMPYLVDTMERLYVGLETKLQAIIHREYTAIHPSVLWKFREEAERHIEFYDVESDLPYQNIKFENLTPLYGQTDIKNSSISRNSAIKQDLSIHLMDIEILFQKLNSCKDPNSMLAKIHSYLAFLEDDLKADTETKIQHFISSKVHPLLDELKIENAENNLLITSYFKNLDPTTQSVYHHRKRFDESVSLINRGISHLLDKRQEEQQKIFPFYYERFKTDGVEHNLYIGSSLAPQLSYSDVFLKNLKLWQLRVVCETEIIFQTQKAKLSFPLEVTSLILAYGGTLNIQFRMDEKRFDVDGSYNARYEVIKKRIDKALVKNSQERLVQPGKLSIVFAQKSERDDYLKYVQLLQNEGVLKDDIEIVELENLQGMVGFQAIRVSYNYCVRNFNYSFIPEI
ncbi:GAF domain-containing protein [Kaistella montana]|uniref:GAF domain-containing protein n=1 Tax=Kaistella montana TaxID=1849733 RepID=A0ABW5K9L9_9FLAO|nr:GAF domain-containing protein [Kaistella montana]MCQ4034776.1 GAF domain-containing protein [Kaistella montana]